MKAPELAAPCHLHALVDGDFILCRKLRGHAGKHAAESKGETYRWSHCTCGACPLSVPCYPDPAAVAAML